MQKLKSKQNLRREQYPHRSDYKGKSQVLTSQKGITLIALIVTVIVALILSAVTIDLAIDGGLIGKAGEAAQAMNLAQINERAQLNAAMALFGNTSGGGGSGGTTGGGETGGGTTGSSNYPFQADGSWNAAKGVNSPKLLSGMTPIYWDSSGNEQIVREANYDNWYDYEDNKWANAKTIDGSYWVWIPRFAYRITDGCYTSSPTIDVCFLEGTTNNATNIEIDCEYPTVNNGVMSSFVVHPSFTDGHLNNYMNGEWDTEITGFWVAKYETSRTDATSSSAGSNTSIQSKPGKYTSLQTTIGDMFTLGLNYDTDKNSHMAKNSEYGALAYLTWSNYGTNGTNLTASTTAVSGGGSTSTGNITGVYDLAGASSEYTSAYIPNGTNSIQEDNSTLSLSYGSSFVGTTIANANGYLTLSNKYATAYPYNASSDTSSDSLGTYMNLKSTTYGFGDAILETRGIGLYPSLSEPFFYRSGVDQQSSVTLETEPPKIIGYSTSINDNYYAYTSTGNINDVNNNYTMVINNWNGIVYINSIWALGQKGYVATNIVTTSWLVNVYYTHTSTPYCFYYYHDVFGICNGTVGLTRGGWSNTWSYSSEPNGTLLVTYSSYGAAYYITRLYSYMAYDYISTPTCSCRLVLIGD